MKLTVQLGQVPAQGNTRAFERARTRHARQASTTAPCHPSFTNKMHKNTIMH